ncbi:MAG: molybdopterin adenylyltransferase [Planctomycetota bacterium]
MPKLPIIQPGIVTISDRASSGIYEDRSGPAIESYLRRVIANELAPRFQLIADEQPIIETALRELVREQCPLILTTGGTGPATRDVTPEAMENVCEKMLPGFGEQMRAISLKYVPTAILSRQTAGIAGNSLIINLPGKPKAIDQCLDAIFAAVPYCIDLIDGPRIETRPDTIKAFRPGGDSGKNERSPSPPTTSKE